MRNIIKSKSEQFFKFLLNPKTHLMIALLIVLIIVFIIILIGVNIYLLALYCHPDDKGWGNVVYCKILVVLGLTLCQAQALMVPLDVANQSALIVGGINMFAFWTFLYIVVLFMISVFIPFALFFYQTDQADTKRKRFLTALCYTFGAIVISVMLLFITWAVFKWVKIPYKQLSLKLTDTVADITQPISVVNPTSADKQMQLQASLAVYVMAILSFFGWVFLVLFGGVGLFALPIDMINEFRHRPRARKAAQMRKAKDALVTAINVLIKQGQEVKAIDQANYKNTQAGFFDRWKGGRNVSKKLTEFKAKYFALQQQYTLFNLELKYSETNPIVPFLKLLLGIIFLITSLLWIIQIIFGNIAKAYRDRPLIPFFNQLFIGLDQKNAGFLATFIFAYLCLYMLWCVQKGNIKFGIRIPFCCRFHPMKQNQTWMNSFLFNVILLLIASVGVIQLCISSFPTYTRNTDIYMIFGNTINYMNFYRAFYQNNVFTIAFVIWTFIALIYMLITINKKPAYMKEIQRIQKQKDQEHEKIAKSQKRLKQ